jgi:serine carboxypeptidase-like clade 1
VGNPVTDGNFDNPAKVPFAHGMGLISDEMYQVLFLLCESDLTTWIHA